MLFPLSALESVTQDSEPHREWRHVTNQFYDVLFPEESFTWSANYASCDIRDIRDDAIEELIEWEASLSQRQEEAFTRPTSPIVYNRGVKRQAEERLDEPPLKQASFGEPIATSTPSAEMDELLNFANPTFSVQTDPKREAPRMNETTTNERPLTPALIRDAFNGNWDETEAFANAETEEADRTGTELAADSPFSPGLTELETAFEPTCEELIQMAAQ